MTSVIKFTKELLAEYGTRIINILIQNASIMPRDYATSPQGFEIAIATNVLGPHLLLRRLLDMGLLSAERYF